ncbi:MAG TPA: hypothetical protein DCF68_20385 [Cyanothece sp. UBA12306]|nr:hypothetical protein [Cyanothece sp. UBA12306]
MGGLLSPLQPLDFYQSPQQIQFEFKEGIREEFLNSLGKGEFCLAVIGSLTEKIASHFGYQTVKEFEGVLIDKPLELSQEDDLELIQVFATISVSTLRQYGAEYAPYIRKLDRSRARLNLGSAINQNARDYNWIDFLEEQAKKHNLTEVQTETLINLFPTPQKSCSVSDVAKQFLCSVSNIRKRLSRIYGKFESLNPSFFQPKRSAKLSTLQQYLSSQYVKICLLRQSAIPADAISQLETLELFEFEADVAIIVDKSVPEPQSEPQSSDKKLDQLTFETPTVNRSGEIIKTTTHTASYFTEKLANDVDLEMVAIPGGTFTMGSPESEKDSYDDERPQHNVTVSPFFMGKYPITQGQWKEIAQRTDLKINIDLDEDPSNFKKPYQDQDREIDRWQRPVEQVNWYEAVEFCQRLSKLTRRDYRLPSEAQWEYACRSQKSEVRSQKSELTIAQWNEKYNQPFYFGETITADLVNYRASSTYADEPNGEYRSQTTPVGQFPPNAFGLYDMHGNVWEWCQDDWHDNYDGAPTDGSAWIDGNEDENSPQENSLESRENDENLNQENDLKSSENDENQPNTVLRGGSWLNDPVNCRSAYRFYFYPREDRIGNSGFRVVCVFGSG